jgi:hypothetical protein
MRFCVVALEPSAEVMNLQANTVPMAALYQGAVQAA